MWTLELPTPLSPFHWLQVPGRYSAGMYELFPDATVRSRQRSSKYSCLILHTALVSNDKDNDSVSVALGGKLSCQVWTSLNFFLRKEK